MARSSVRHSALLKRIASDRAPLTPRLARSTADSSGQGPIVKPKWTSEDTGVPPDTVEKKRISVPAGSVTGGPASTQEVFKPLITHVSEVDVIVPDSVEVVREKPRFTPVPGATSRDTERLAALTGTAGVRMTTGRGVVGLVLLVIPETPKTRLPVVRLVLPVITAVELAPAAPAGPVGPMLPVAPVTPWDPVAPADPSAPAVPVAPVCPAGPIDPAGPAGPAAPVSPRGS